MNPFRWIMYIMPTSRVWGAKRTGIPSILVRPIHPKEEIQIVLKRYLENIVLHFYKKSLEKEKKVEKSSKLL